MSKASAYFQLGNMSGGHDAKQIKRELDSLPGVISVSVNKGKHTVAVDFDSTGVQQEQISKMLCDLGYQLKAEKTENHLM